MQRLPPQITILTIHWCNNRSWKIGGHYLGSKLHCGGGIFSSLGFWVLLFFCYGFLSCWTTNLIWFTTWRYSQVGVVRDNSHHKICKIWANVVEKKWHSYFKFLLHGPWQKKTPCLINIFDRNKNSTNICNIFIFYWITLNKFLSIFCERPLQDSSIF